MPTPPCAVPRGARRTLSALAGLLLLGVLVAAPASAHVTVGVDDAHQGATDAVLTFRVPNERSGTSTVKLEIKFPTRTPIASVIPEPKPGWTVDTTVVDLPKPITTDDGEITKSVSDVTFTASSPEAGIPEDRFDTFRLLVGPLPTGVDSLSFPTVQTYANGDVSQWVEPSLPGSEPEHPAPTLKLLPAAAEAEGGDGATVTATSADDAAATARTARTFGIAGTIIGVLGLCVAAVALGRSRRT